MKDKELEIRINFSYAFIQLITFSLTQMGHQQAKCYNCSDVITWSPLRPIQVISKEEVVDTS